MKKHLSVVVLVCFLSAQLFSLWHLGEHAFEKHQHNGQICSVYLHNKVADDLAIPSAHLSALVFDQADAPAQRIISFHTPLTPNFFHARAPPIA